jgi:hypothetical protein
MVKVRAKTTSYREVVMEVFVNKADIFEMAAIDDYGAEWKVGLDVGGHNIPLDSDPYLKFTIKRWIVQE